MRDYEMMVVMHPTISDEEMPQALERVGGMIAAQGGEPQGDPNTEAPWGRRRLAYPINDQRDGFYALYLFQLDPSRTLELDRVLKLNDDVLRHFVARHEEEEERPARQIPQPQE